MAKQLNSTTSTINPNGAGLSLGDLGMIREILVGQQMSQIEHRFAEMSEIIEQLRGEVVSTRKTMEKEMAQQMSSMERETASRFDKLEKHFNTELEKLRSDATNMTNTERQKLGNLLAQMAQTLLGEQ
ncbi:MAG: hypothetical protein KA974_03450 [Saprospiraceae bacterium]|nr:hypothetical protein [Saprospiraceae bacterium]MBP7699721.1 hypothetical protein [Saprospiraceae bacterium]